MRCYTLLFICCGAALACGAPPPIATQDAYAASECGACVSSACKPPLRECGADSACARYLFCLGRCPLGPGGDADTGCAARCAQGVPASSQMLLLAVSQCRALGPGAACAPCGLEGPGAIGAALFNQRCEASLETRPCQRCYQESCCESRAACLQGSCSKLVDCIDQRCPKDPNNPSYLPCIATCRRENREGRADYGRFNLCAQVRCWAASACDLGPNPCQQCAARLCSNLLVRAFTEEICLDVNFCEYGCMPGDTACLQRCAQATAQCLSQVYAPLALCEQSQCPGECG